MYLRLSELRQMQWQDRAHFLSMAARVCSLLRELGKWPEALPPLQQAVALLEPQV